MARIQPGGSTGWSIAYRPHVGAVLAHVWPGRCAGRLPGRYAGRPDLPVHLPALAGAYPLANGEMDLPRRSGTDD